MPTSPRHKRAIASSLPQTLWGQVLVHDCATASRSSSTPVGDVASEGSRHSKLGTATANERVLLVSLRRRKQRL